jgi:hypothetical protein
LETNLDKKKLKIEHGNIFKIIIIEKDNKKTQKKKTSLIKKNYQFFSNSNPNMQNVKRKGLQALVIGNNGTTTTTM